MFFGIILVVLIALLAVAVLIEIVGSLGQVFEKSRTTDSTKTAPGTQVSDPGIAASQIDKETTLV